MEYVQPNSYLHACSVLVIGMVAICQVIIIFITDAHTQNFL